MKQQQQQGGGRGVGEMSVKQKPLNVRPYGDDTVKNSTISKVELGVIFPPEKVAEMMLNPQFGTMTKINPSGIQSSKYVTERKNQMFKCSYCGYNDGHWDGNCYNMQREKEKNATIGSQLHCRWMKKL